MFPQTGMKEEAGLGAAAKRDFPGTCSQTGLLATMRLACESGGLQLAR